jgi:putative transposase
LDHFTKILRTVKAGSSSWLKSEFPEANNFAWQDGYGSFCVSRSLLDTTCKYIQNQEKHHAKITFEDEYIKILDFHGVDYDPKYVFD